ncbi:MAG TPA: hypothetical protein VL126_03585 [Bacteroidota bacterium]|nr:hypothetical protein [Bacteroidota bacterium]
MQSRLLYALFFALAPVFAFGQESSAVQTVTFAVQVEHRIALSELKSQPGEKITRTIELPRGASPSRAQSAPNAASQGVRSASRDDRTSVGMQKEPDGSISQDRERRCVITVTE